MKSRFLIPHKYKLAGWIVFIPSLVMAFLSVAYEIEPKIFDLTTISIVNDQLLATPIFFKTLSANLFSEIMAILAIVSGIIVAFSKMKHEDELIQSLRLNSLVWATYVNYIALALAILLVFGMSFFWVVLFNIFTLLVFFIGRFYYKYYAFQKAANYEE